MTVAMLSSTVDSTAQTTRQADEFRVQTVAESITSMAVANIWSGYERFSEERGQRSNEFRIYLENAGFPDQAAAADPQGVDYLASLGLPVDADGNPWLDGINVDACEVYRVDAGTETRLVVTTATSGGLGRNGANSNRSAKTVQQSFSVEPEEWEGLDYALLANNINCVMCHMEIDSAERVYNQDITRYGTFDRVRMGSIESFHLRANPHSKVAGTVYLGGEAIDGGGSAISNWSSLNFLSAEFDANGKLQQDAWGDLITDNLSPASAADPDALENLYIGYFDETSAQVDGYMPSSFPSPFPDDGGWDPDTGKSTPELGNNRVLDHNEFMAAVAGSNGQITGGTINILDPGAKIHGNENKLVTANSDSLDGIVDGTVYLNGTKENPILLNGDVAIDGDLVITGYVKGEGALNVSGNVYIPSDLKYDDGSTLLGGRTYGTADDGTVNALAIASAGNISVGDFYKPAWRDGKNVTGKTNGNFSFIMEELAAFNRKEWTKTQPTLPGKPVKIQTGTKTRTTTKDEKVKEYYWKTVKVYEWQKTGKKIKKKKYKWVWKNNGKPEPYYKEWKVKEENGFKWVDEKKRVHVSDKQVRKYRWKKTGNKITTEHSEPIMEWVTPQYDNTGYVAEYMPRYYSFSEGDPVVVHNKGGYWDETYLQWHGAEAALGWDMNKLTMADPSDTSNSLLYDSLGNARAVISTVAATDDWIDDTAMRSLIESELDDHDPNAPLEVNALLYSNNSIFGVLAGDKSAETSNGELLFNGGIVASDVGLLSPGGIKLNYDNRGAGLLDLASESSLTIRRSLWVAGH